jgi:hypothetical protein
VLSLLARLAAAFAQLRFFDTNLFAAITQRFGFGSS